MNRFTDDQIRRARERYTLSSLIGRDVKLRKHGHEWIGLCPFHKERTPSFTVSDPKGFYHCFGCGAHGDAIAWRMETHAESFAEAIVTLTGEAAPDDDGVRRMVAERAVESEAREISHDEIVRQIVPQTLPIVGTPGDGYFRGRGITMPLPPSLRWMPRCLRRSSKDWEYLPAVVCLVQDLADETVAVHRIYLDPATLGSVPRLIGSSPAKALLGNPRDGSIRLAPAAAAMGRCEGVETGLSVRQVIGTPIWSAITGGHMAKQAFPPLVECMTTYADRDPVVWQPESPMYGRRPGDVYAERAAAADRAAGRRVLLASPPGEKEDFNDMLQETDE